MDDPVDLDPATTPPWRLALSGFIQNHRFQYTIISVIVINAVVLGLEAVPPAMAAFGSVLLAIDKACLGVFVVELLLKAVAHRWRMLKSGWNVFDIVVVAIALVPAIGPLAVLRSLRVLRVLRLATSVPALRKVVTAFLHAIPGLGAVVLLLTLLMYVAGVMATGFFGASHPQWFGDLGSSLYTLFQIMTLESWSMGVVRPVMEIHPWAWLFFVPFIVIATFTILNLFIGIIVSTMQELAGSEITVEPAGGSQPSPSEETTAILARIEADLAELKRRIG